MVWTIAKILLAGIIIAFTSWLAGKKPILAGFILALPISTLIALLFNYVEFGDPAKSVLFAKSIFFSVPISLLFFVPFLFADRLKLHFFGLYISGVVLLGLGYFLHKKIMGEG